MAPLKLLLHNVQYFYVKLVSIPTYKAASPNIFFALPGFEENKGKVAINVSVFGFNRYGNYSQLHNNVYLIDVLLEDDKTICFGQHWPSSGFSSERIVCCKRLLYPVCQSHMDTRTTNNTTKTEHTHNEEEITHTHQQ